MAKHPHDDQSKKANGDQPKTPKPVIPNMSLDEPVEPEPLEVEEVLEDDIPVVEAAPASAEEPFVLSEADVIEEVEEAEAVEEADEVFAAEEAVPTGSSAVLVEAAPAADVPPAPPASDVDLASLFGEEPAAVPTPAPVPAEPAATHEPAPEAPPSFAVLAAASPPIEPAQQASETPAPAADWPASDVFTADEQVEPAAPSSAVSTAAEHVEAAPPASGVAVVEEHVEQAPPPSGVTMAEAPVEPITEAAPPSGIAEAAPASEVVAADEAIEEVEEAAPASEIVAADEAIEEVAEAAPASEVVAADEAVEEVAEAAPASGVLFDEEVAEAAPASEARSAEVLAEEAEAVEEVSSATRKAEAVLEDEIAEAEAASTGSVIEEAVAEEADETEAMEAGALSDIKLAGSSAVKKPRSDVNKTAQFEQTMAFEPPPPSGLKTVEDDILVTEEEVAGVGEASAVNLGDMGAPKGSSVKGIDKVAEALESGLDLAGEEGDEAEKLAATVPSVEFDELLDEEIDEQPVQKKKKPTRAHDDDLTEMETVAPKGKKGKAPVKATGDEIDALPEEIEAAEAAEEFEEVAEVEPAEAFEEFEEFEEVAEAEPAEALEAEEEAEAAEAFDAEEAAEAEAAEAFDEELEAAEAFDAEEAEEAEAAEALDAEEAEAAAFFDEDEDEKPKKKGKSKVKLGKKKSKLADEDEDLEDEDEEDLSAKKKKKGKEKATTRPEPARPSTFLRLVVGGMLASILLIGGAAAAIVFAPEEVKNLADMSPMVEPKSKDDGKDKTGPKVAEKTNLEKARAEMAAGKFDDAITLLKDSTDAAEVGARGEARWYSYFKQQVDKKEPLDKDADAVKAAIADLTGKNDMFLAQVLAKLDEKALTEKVANLKAVEDKLDETKIARDAAEKKLAEATNVLIKGNFIKKDGDLGELDKIIKGLSDDRTMLAAVNKLLDDAKFKEGAEGIKEVLAKKKDADDNVAAVAKVLEDEKIKDAGAKGVLMIVDARNTFKKERDSLMTTIAAAFKELVDGKIVKDDADPVKEIVAGTKIARQKAESPLSIPLAQLSMSLGTVGSGTGKVVEQSFDMAKVFSELGYFRGREGFIQTPEQKMDNYIAILQDRRRNDAKEIADITREAQWVRDNTRNKDDAPAKARYVQGLGLRNQEKFAEAKKAFADTLTMIPKIPKAGSWTELAHRSHRELVDPTAYYIPRMDRFQADGNPRAAFDEANLAIKAIPDDARLFAQRGLIRLELIKGKGAKAPDDAQKDIRADAATAAKDAKLAAESSYIVGLLEEELGNVTEAEKMYRQALKMHAGMDEAAGKYRVALARLLLRDRTEGAAPVEPPPADEDKKKKDDKGETSFFPLPPKEGSGVRVATPQAAMIIHPWTMLAVSAVIAQPQPFDEVEDKATIDRLNETLKLAEELIASKNDKIKGQGYLLKGSALSRLGKRTEGLKEYTKGLKMVFPGIETDEMKQLVEDHPAFQQPDISSTPNPIMAEKHFGEGMHLYWSQQYPQAEAQFRQAVKFYALDARYQYFLGLSQLLQKTKLKRDAAIFSFEQGARLEAKMISTNPDAVREINASLERIQGELRQYLNTHRYRAMATDPEAKDAK